MAEESNGKETTNQNESTNQEDSIGLIYKELEQLELLVLQQEYEKQKKAQKAA